MNPIDVVTYAALKIHRLRSRFGSNVLDTSRLRYLVSRETGVALKISCVRGGVSTATLRSLVQR